ncbi:MAG: 50S ribosomal protein L21 [Candidatus Omnitrophota bacterium]
MYAVIELQGTQVLVQKDGRIEVNRMEEQKSKTIKIEKVLFGKKGASYFVGTPYIEDAYVECEIIGDKRSKKVIAFKYRDRKSSQSKKGHRQDLTELKVKNIHFEPQEKK